jgi:hypothetical protein
MRINIKGKNVSALALRGMLRKSGFVVSEAGALLSVAIEESETESFIVVDGVDSELERLVVNSIAELSLTPILLRRGGSRQSSDHEIAITVPARDAERIAVERGVLRALIRASEPKSVEASRGRATGRIRRFLARFFVVLFVGTGVLLAPQAHAQELTVNRSNEAAQLSTPKPSQAQALEIRDLQFRQDKLLIEEKNLEIEYARVGREARALDSEIERAVRRAAAALHVSLDAYRFDLDALCFVPRPASPNPSIKQEKKN